MVNVKRTRNRSLSKIVNTIILLILATVISAQYRPRMVLPIGHTGSINSAVFSPDGNYVLTASDDKTARIYEVSSGNELHVLSGHSSKINTAVFCPEGKYALTASDDSTARIYEVSSGKGLYVLSGHEGFISSAVFSSDGMYVLTSSMDKTARIFEVSSGKEVQILKGHSDWVRSAVFSPDNKHVLTASRDKTARVYEVSSGKEVYVIEEHAAAVNSAFFSSDGKYVLTASDDRTARIFEMSSGRILCLLKGHNSTVNSAVFSNNGKYVLTASDDYSSRIYDVSSGKEIHILLGNSFINFAVFSPNCQYAVTVDDINTVCIYEVLTGKEVHLLSDQNSKINSAVFSPDGNYLMTAGEDQSTRIYEVSSGKEVRKISGQTLMINSALFSPNGENVLTSCHDEILRIFKVSSGQEQQIFSGHQLPIHLAVYSPSGEYVLTASSDLTARLYEVASGKEIQILSGHDFFINSIGFSPDGKNILTSGFDEMVRFYDVFSGQERQILSGNMQCIQSDSFTPDGMYTIVIKDNSAFIYEVCDGKELRELFGHKSTIHSVFFSKDGKFAITASQDKTARIYDVKSGEEIHLLLGHTESVSYASFSPSGELALTVGDDLTARIYNVFSGKEIHNFSCNNIGVRAALFSPDGKYVLTICSDNNIRVFDVFSGLECQILVGHHLPIQIAIFSSDEKYILTSSEDHKTILWDFASGKALYTRLQLTDNDWLVYDEHYRFDGTPGAIEKLYFTCGLEVIELGQMKDALYVPGLVGKIMNGEDINYKKLNDLDICGALPIIEKIKESSEGWEFSIEQRRWPIIRLEVKVDGKTVSTISPSQLQWNNDKTILRIAKESIRVHLIQGQENEIELIAITQYYESEFKSRGIVMETNEEGEKVAPDIYMLMIGVSDYKDDALDLRFPVQDAIAFSSALESCALKLLGNNKVFVFNVQSKTENNLVFTTPEKAGIMKALEEIGKKAKSNDVLFIFFAGHGVMHGLDNTFTFLTADASKLNPIGISTKDLKSWLSPEGPFHIMPNKTVLVYDACNSGQASKELADLAMARDDNATERQRQIEDLGDKSGVFILSASAPNQSAYELPHLGQGMLTYSLLTTLKNNPGVLDESQDGNGFLNLQKWFLETEREQRRLAQSLGLRQDAQPYGTANIRIGIVDDEVRDGIKLLSEKPLVYCSTARNENEEDPIDLKIRVNNFLEKTCSVGISSKLGFAHSENSNSNVFKLVYNVNGDLVQCRILIFKNKVKTDELEIVTTVNRVEEDILKSLEDLFK